MLKKSLSLILALFLIFSTKVSIASEKYKSMPSIFEVKVEIKDRLQNKDKEYILKEYVRTSNASVNAELAKIVDDFDSMYSPILRERASQKPKLYNRLDIETTYYRTGDSALSSLVIARTTYKKKQKEVFFTTRTFDLKSGKRILLEDLFSDERAFELIRERVLSYFGGLFEGEERNQEAIDKASTNEAIRKAEFTISGQELTLHFNSSDFFENKTGLLHVRFFYKEFENMFSETGLQYTDNSKWKMVALTFDDGPRGDGTSKTLNELRKAGLRATFFTVGSHYEEYNTLLHRSYDANHKIENHSWNHWNGHGLNTTARLKQVRLGQEYLLRELGEAAKFFRAPVGTYPPWIEAKIGLPIIQWSVDSYDYRGRPANVILSNIKKNIQEGDIVLLHDTGKITNTTIAELAKFLLDNGYMAVSVEELSIEHDIITEPNTLYFRFLNGVFDERKDSNTN